MEERGLKLSITDGGREGTSNVIASCGCVKEKFQECSEREGVGLCTQGEDIRSGI